MNYGVVEYNITYLHVEATVDLTTVNPYSLNFYNVEPHLVYITMYMGRC